MTGHPGVLRLALRDDGLWGLGLASLLSREWIENRVSFVLLLWRPPQGSSGLKHVRAASFLEQHGFDPASPCSIALTGASDSLLASFPAFLPL